MLADRINIKTTDLYVDIDNCVGISTERGSDSSGGIGGSSSRGDSGGLMVMAKT